MYVVIQDIYVKVPIFAKPN